MMKTETKKTVIEIVAEETTKTFTMQIPGIVLTCMQVLNAGKWGVLSGNAKTIRDNWTVEGCQTFVNAFFDQECMPENFCHHCGELNPKWESIDDAEFNADGIPGKILHPCCQCGEER